MEDSTAVLEQLSRIHHRHSQGLELFQKCLNELKQDLDNSLTGLETTLGDKRIDTASAKGITYLLKSTITVYKSLRDVLASFKQDSLEQAHLYGKLENPSNERGAKDNQYVDLKLEQIHRDIKKLPTETSLVEIHQKMMDFLISTRAPEHEPIGWDNNNDQEASRLQDENMKLMMELCQITQLEQQKTSILHQREIHQLGHAITQLQTQIDTVKKQTLNMNRFFTLPLTDNQVDGMYQDAAKSAEMLAKSDVSFSNTRVSALQSHHDNTNVTISRVLDDLGPNASRLVESHTNLFKSVKANDEELIPFASQSSLLDSDHYSSLSHDEHILSMPSIIPSIDLTRIRHQAHSALHRLYTTGSQNKWLCMALQPVSLATPATIQHSATLLARYYLWN